MVHGGQSSDYEENSELGNAEESESEIMEGGGQQPSNESVEQDISDASNDELQARLEAALLALNEQKELVLRAKAEAQNTLRRAEREVEHAHKFGQEKFLQELLPVVDNLERALSAPVSEQGQVQALREGVELTLDLFIKTLEKFHVEQLDPRGEPFDPQLHQAMSMVESDSVEANTVVDVMQKGYRLNGRLVRPAMVMVSKGRPQDAPKIDEQA